MTQPTDNVRLYDALCGPYSRRCVEPCPDCKGTGGIPPKGDFGRMCYTCDGNGVAFREDEAGLEMIERAVKDWYWKEHDAGRRPLTINVVAMKLWESRNGMPWQSAIEQHIRDYIAPAPDFRTNTEVAKTET